MAINIWSDATAAIGIARRKGLGKIRHLACTDLWVQDKIRSKQIVLQKVLGADNPADITTKYVERKVLEMALPKLGLIPTAGRPVSAPVAMGVQLLAVFVRCWPLIMSTWPPFMLLIVPGHVVYDCQCTCVVLFGTPAMWCMTAGGYVHWDFNLSLIHI